MARAKKSSLDMDEPVVVQGEDEMVEPTVTEATAVKVEETKKEEQSKADTKKARRGIKICVF